MPLPPDGPVGLPLYKTSYDPDAEYTSIIGPTATIKDIYLQVMEEQPLEVSSAADAWDALAEHLGTIKTMLEHDYHGVRAHWDSEAGLLFGDFVDNSTLSLADWQEAASRNAEALRDLASAIFLAQADIGALWTEFDRKVALVDQNHGGHAGDLPYGIMLELTNKAKSDVLEPLNKAYFDAYMASRPGGKFVGPTNGPNSADLARALKTLREGPGVTPPGAPGVGPADTPGPPVPAAPPTPGPKPPRRPAPPRPIRPPLPKRAAPPPDPTPVPRRLPPMPPPVAPVGPPEPPPVSYGPPELPPVSYGPPLATDPMRSGPPADIPLTPQAFRPPPVADPTPVVPPSVAGPAPVESASPARPSAPEVPSRLRGRGSVAEPELPRGPMPRLPGRGSRPNPPRPGTPHGQDPDAPPPRRGGPALPGRNGNTRRAERNGQPAGPPDDDPPPNRLAAPRDLLGIRDTKPRMRPGSAEIERPAVQRSARLTGRFGDQPDRSELPLRPALSGRGGRPAAEPGAGDRAIRTDPRRIDFLGDAELFSPGSATPSVIERPAEAEPVAAEEHALRPRPDSEHEAYTRSSVVRTALTGDRNPVR